MQLNCWSFRCSWSTACQRCSNYIFILNLTPGFNGFGKDNYKMRREVFKFWDLVRLILETLRYFRISWKDSTYKSKLTRALSVAGHGVSSLEALSKWDRCDAGQETTGRRALWWNGEFILNLSVAQTRLFWLYQCTGHPNSTWATLR